MRQVISATSKYIRISPRKIDVIISKIRGKTYREALVILKTLRQKSGVVVWKTLYSAISNAAKNFNLKKENLFVQEAFVNQGSILKRIRARSKGRAYRIEKKISHLTIRVSENRPV